MGRAALGPLLYGTAVSTRLTPGELEYIVNDCGAKVFVTSKALAPLAEAIRNRLPSVVHKLMVGEQASEPDKHRAA